MGLHYRAEPLKQQVVLASAEAEAAREVLAEQARVALAALPALAAQQSTLTRPGARSAAS